jgi:antitoxin component of MazEF toxin-antitoxin module
MIRLKSFLTDTEIRIPSEMLEGSSCSEGDEFDLQVEGGRIVLQKSSGSG